MRANSGQSSRIMILVILITALGVIAYAQNVKPPLNTVNGVTYTWKNGSVVVVYLNSDDFPVDSTAYNSVVNGFGNAQSAYNSYDQVLYHFEDYTGDEPACADQCVYVYSDIPPGGGAGEVIAEDTTQVSSTLAYFNVVDMYLNPNLNSAGLTTVSGHEDSHLYGIGDCPKCLSYDDSLMWDSVDYNSDSIYTPTQNDIEEEELFQEGIPE